MRRRIFNILAAISLVLCVALIALWARSYFRTDALQHISPAPADSLLTYRSIGSVRGHLLYNRQELLPTAGIVSRMNPIGWRAYSTSAAEARLPRQGLIGCQLPFPGLRLSPCSTAAHFRRGTVNPGLSGRPFSGLVPRPAIRRSSGALAGAQSPPTPQAPTPPVQELRLRPPCHAECRRPAAPNAGEKLRQPRSRHRTRTAAREAEQIRPVALFATFALHPPPLDPRPQKLPFAGPLPHPQHADEPARQQPPQRILCSSIAPGTAPGSHRTHTVPTPLPAHWPATPSNCRPDDKPVRTSPAVSSNPASASLVELPAAGPDAARMFNLSTAS